MKSPTNFVIVESPAKARTLSRILGPKYIVKASMGHIRDLPKSKLGVDTENDFKPQYLVMRDKSSILKELKEGLSKASAVFLATDPDREGEAIAWHLKESICTPRASCNRVTFHEITPEAITAAFNSPREINMNLVNAQQARRILDRLVGYKLSPLLWQKIRRGLSAGRVQSVALRIIVDREREILSFKPEEYWTIEVDLIKHNSTQKFKATLIGQGDKRRISIKTEEQALAVEKDLGSAKYSVSSVGVKEVMKQPSPPFITSTLQQEAYRKLRFTARQTMAIAQQLYEGLPIGTEGSVGLITYMRTDSIQVSGSAISEARKYIERQFGNAYLPKNVRSFTSSVKGAQEAHEAIRPTSVEREPQLIKEYLETNQFKLYQLIWQRMVASQMTAAKFRNTTVDITAKIAESKGAYILRSQQTEHIFSGFISLYVESRDDAEEIKTPPIPELVQNEELHVKGIHKEQRFTQPQPRYSEATLVKTLEQYGIGRPSTYAPILSVVQEREYVTKEKGLFKPTDLGMTVSDMLVQQFPELIDTRFTAQMESKLDKVAVEGIDWVGVVRDFFIPFSNNLTAAEEQLERVPLPVEVSTEYCPQCSKGLLLIKIGRFGKYMECPSCSFRQSFRIRTGVPCPGCPENGELIGRFTKKGKLFYGCSAFPKHAFAINTKPLSEPCPLCGGLVVEVKPGVNACQNPVCEAFKPLRRRSPKPDSSKSHKPPVRKRRTSVKKAGTGMQQASG
ncbi:type I DNA topoisomerase [Dehalogenimonas alkenigignens]|uniref:type I DNA topoisomerase n=1 Tax=Dehalogenimonas alkenigignens TaxID=1217799 RepID=UPI000D57E578|nr:type I DNA topoisomerase [Dehalogenimonas alkenigignens]PVV85061.1 type I DNA topoisomerase [Dehalogenimonas alkenigignens]